MKNEAEQLEKLEKTAQSNAVGFFNLLLQIDKRLNPQLYKSCKLNVYERTNVQKAVQN